MPGGGPGGGLGRFIDPAVTHEETRLHPAGAGRATPAARCTQGRCRRLPLSGQSAVPQRLQIWVQPEHRCVGAGIRPADPANECAMPACSPDRWHRDALVAEKVRALTPPIRRKLGVRTPDDHGSSAKATTTDLIGWLFLLSAAGPAVCDLRMSEKQGDRSSGAT